MILFWIILGNLQLDVERLHWFCFTLLLAWGRKLAPFSRPIRYRSKTKRDLNARVFPRLRLCSRVYFEFWLVRYVVHLFFWLAVGIAMVLDTKSNHFLLETILTQDIWLYSVRRGCYCFLRKFLLVCMYRLFFSSMQVKEKTKRRSDFYCYRFFSLALIRDIFYRP